MLRINAIPNTAAGKAYYSVSDYMIEGEQLHANWHGKGAEYLGLTGTVQKDDFDLLCENRHPQTGNQLTAKHIENRRVGYDFTFSVPKSVSLLYSVGQDDRLSGEFRGAVADTMAEMEREMSTRVRKKRADFDRKTGNMLWCDFLHHTSRPINGTPDPQLHVHAVVFNATIDSEEGQWKAGQFGGLKKDAPYYQAVFRSRLANRMQDLGYTIERKKDDFEITGVPKRTLTEFSRRTTLIEKLADQLGVTKPETKAKLGATSREAKKEGQTWDSLIAGWENRLKEGELEAINATVAKALKGHDAPELANGAALDFALRHTLERSSVVGQRELLTTALKHGLGNVTPEGIHAELGKRRDVIRRDMDGRTLVSTQGVLAEEKKILSFAQKGRGRFRPLQPKGRDNVIGEVRDLGYSAESSQGHLSPSNDHKADTATTPPFDQASLYTSADRKDTNPTGLLNSLDDKRVVNPGQPTGKPEVDTNRIREADNRIRPQADRRDLTPVLETFRDGELSTGGSGQSKKPVRPPVGNSVDNGASGAQKIGPARTESKGIEFDRLSPSQAAAVRHAWQSRDRLILIRGAAGTGKTTMTKALLAGVDVPWVILAPSAEASRGVLRKEGFTNAETLAKFLTDNDLQKSVKNGLIVLDEASLAGAHDLARLVESADQLNARIILLGDRRQHKSVARGDVLALLEDRAGLPVAEVSEIRRQSGEYKAAVAMASKGNVAGAVKKLDSLGWVKEMDRFADASKAIADEYVAGLNAGKSMLVVSPTHAQGDLVTAAIREKLKQEGKLNGKEQRIEALENANLTQAEASDPETLKAHKGEEAQFHRHGIVRAGERVTITEENAEALAKQGSRFTVYRPKPLDLVKGDLIRVTAGIKDADGKRIDNGSMLTYLGMTDKGQLKVEMASGTKRVLPANVGHLSHGYVKTSYSSQGPTFDRVLIHMPVATFGAVDKATGYVSISRGRESAKIFTDNREELLEAVNRDRPRMLVSELVRRPRHRIRERLKRHVRFLRELGNQLGQKAHELVRGKEMSMDR